MLQSPINGRQGDVLAEASRETTAPEYVLQSGWIEIFFLAMLAAFIGLRLYHVLGHRTGQERPLGEQGDTKFVADRQFSETIVPEPERQVVVPEGIPANARPGVQKIMEADQTFDPEAFMDSAQVAYQMILKAFWGGDVEAVSKMVSDEIHDNFQRAIDERADRGERMENQLLEVDSVRIKGAAMRGTMAEVTLQFDAEMVRVTRNDAGEIITGDPDTSIVTHDLWTFSRHTRSPDPTWLLVAVDEAGQTVG